jgi:hypothetical protein
MKAGNFRLLILFLFCFESSNSLFGQNENRLNLEKCARLETGFIYGGLVSQGNFNLNPGCNFQYSYCIKTGERLGAGAGGGIQFFHERGFIPFYFDVVVLLKANKNSPFLTCQAGYAFGWSKEFKSLQEAAFKGGLYLGAGAGIKYNLNNSFSGYISLSYRHQMASVSYTDESNNKQTDKLNYSMFGLNIGIMLEQL